MEANNVNVDKKADVLNRIKEYSSKATARHLKLIGVVVGLLIYRFMKGCDVPAYIFAAIMAIFALLCVCFIIVYKRIGRADTSTELSNLFKKVATYRIVMAIYFIVISLASLFIAILATEDFSENWIMITLIALVVIFLGGFAWYILKNKNKKTKMGLLIDELQALEEEK